MNYSAMKKIILLAATLFSLSFFANAQSLDKALERLETVRSQKGEQSQEYLTALDTVIWAASMTGDNSMAISYRQHHLDIVKQMKGERCIEVADDLWMLGNASRLLGKVTTSYDYHQLSADVYEDILNYNDSVLISHYVLCLNSLMEECVFLSERERILHCSPKLEQLSRVLYKNDNCSFITTLYKIMQYNYMVGNQDMADYEHYCNEILRECTSIDSCSYSVVHFSYEYLLAYYIDNNRYDLRNKLDLDYLTKLDGASKPFYNELVDVYYDLLISENDDFEEAIFYGKKAEKILIDNTISEEYLIYDETYYKVLDALALTYEMVGDYDSAIHYYQQCCSALTHQNNTNSKEYYTALYGISNCAYKSGNYSLLIETASELEPLIFSFSDTPYEDAVICASNIAFASTRLGQYEDALFYYDKELELIPNLSDKEIIPSAEASVHFLKAQVYHMSGSNEKALIELIQCENMLKGLPATPDVIQTKGLVFGLKAFFVSDYQDAIYLIDTALYYNELLVEAYNDTLENAKGNNIDYDTSGMIDSALLASDGFDRLHMVDRATILYHKGILQFQYGAVSEAYNSFLESASLYGELYSKNSIDYLTIQKNIAYCQMEMGNYSDAIGVLDNSLRKIKELIGENNPTYVSGLLCLSIYFHEIGNLDKVIEYSKRASDICADMGWATQYAQAMIYLGIGYYLKGNLHKAKAILTEGCNLMEKLSSPLSSLSNVYLRLFKLSFELEFYEEGLEYYSKAEKIIESTFGKQSRQYIELLSIVGEVLMSNGYESAFDTYSEVIETMRVLNPSIDSKYIGILVQYGFSSIVYDKQIVNDYVNLMTDALHSYYLNNIGQYSSSDRNLLWNSILTPIKNILYSVRANTEVDARLFAQTAFSKSLMLTTSNRFKESVYQTKDDALIGQYERILSLQKVIDNQSFINLQDGFSVEEMRDNLARMERDLIGKMKDSGAYTIENEITYDSVVRSFKDNEIAIEFVDFYHLKDKKTYYVALLAKTGWDKPVYVQLCTEDELKACLDNPNVTYSTVDLYRLLWHPLSEYIDDSSTVYFSPSGMLHTIALESIHIPDGSCLSDKYNLVRMTSTRELCKEKHPKTYETGAVYGGLQYDVEQQRMAEVASMSKTELEESPAFALRGEDRGNWNYLQGTKDEAEHIAGIMRQANINCNLLEGDLGSEESFKALSGSNTDIIHLATHGYFLEGEKADMNDFMKSLSPLARQKTDSVIDPLLRSGLILSGGNSAWLGKEVPEGIEDGVLTALEISTMNLSGTDMVVMSACETGLGDITSDGVFGLQRAFKMAGVQTLVMSLWKVDDNATSLMMQTFYEHLLSGMSKREAFNLAQAAVRTKYPEPYYWAGFIMLD